MRQRITTAIIGLCLVAAGGLLLAQSRAFLRASLAESSGVYRVLVESSFPVKSTIEKSGKFLTIKIRSNETVRTRSASFAQGYIQSMKWDKGWGYYSLVIEASREDFTYDSHSIEDPPQLIVQINPSSPVHGRIEAEEGAVDEAREKRPSGQEEQPGAVTKRRTAPERRTIVIDPGHGGMEVGAQGKGGNLEKDITLAIAKKLKSIIEKNLAFNVVMTREKDVEVSLESRAALANNHRAFLFVSIHANSSYSKDPIGSESYFLSLNATDREARRLAYMENNSEEFGAETQGSEEDPIQMILWDMAQSAYLKQSSELAENIQQELNTLLGTKNRGIKQAPLMVLAGVACPAVLVEVAFINNPKEEAKLINDRFQSNAALAIYRGLVKFIRKYS